MIRKSEAVFRKDHAQRRSQSEMTIQPHLTDRSAHERPLHRPDVLDEPPGGAGAALPALLPDDGA
jgi:hypothetical protein